jgi:hypothetical protein
MLPRLISSLSYRQSFTVADIQRLHGKLQSTMAIAQVRAAPSPPKPHLLDRANHRALQECSVY